jgi:hypothetical protein
MSKGLLEKLAAAGADVEKIKAALTKPAGSNGTPIADIVVKLSTINDLEYLEKVLKSARGGKSKAKGAKNPVAAVAQYQSHINAINARINELRAEIEAQTTWGAKISLAMKYNHPALLNNLVMPYLQALLDAAMEGVAKANKLSSVQVKTILNSIPDKVCAGLKAELDKYGVYEEFVQRLEDKDNRASVIARKAALLLQGDK